MANLNIDFELMRSIVTSSTQLAEQLRDVSRDLGGLAEKASGMSGRTIEAFCSFIYERAVGVIDETAEMCEQISKSICQTSEQFSETDGAGASVYRV